MQIHTSLMALSNIVITYNSEFQTTDQEMQNTCHDIPRKERLFFNAFHFIKSSPKSFFEPKSGRLTRIMQLLSLPKMRGGGYVDVL